MSDLVPDAAPDASYPAARFLLIAFVMSSIGWSCHERHQDRERLRRVEEYQREIRSLIESRLPTDQPPQARR